MFNSKVNNLKMYKFEDSKYCQHCTRREINFNSPEDSTKVTPIGELNN